MTINPSYLYFISEPVTYVEKATGEVISRTRRISLAPGSLIPLRHSPEHVVRQADYVCPGTQWLAYESGKYSDFPVCGERAEFMARNGATLTYVVNGRTEFTEEQAARLIQMD